MLLTAVFLCATVTVSHCVSNYFSHPGSLLSLALEVHSVVPLLVHMSVYVLNGGSIAQEVFLNFYQERSQPTV